MKKKLVRIAQSYLGMTPADKQCANWQIMQKKMVEEMLAIIQQEIKLVVRPEKKIDADLPPLDVIHAEGKEEGYSDAVEKINEIFEFNS